MKNMSADLAIKDIMGRDNDNKETSVIIDNSNDGKLLLVTSRRYINQNCFEKYLCLTFTQPLNLNRTTNAGIKKEMVEPQLN